MLIHVILALSIIFQFVAAIAAIRLTFITRRRVGWLAIATGILLMSIRRSITLVRSLAGEAAIQPDPAAELVALITSALMLAGIVWIGPLFTSIQRINDALRRTTRAWRTLSECNQAIARTHSEQELVQEICRILVEAGGYRFAWVGLAQQDEDKSVRPVAQYGFEKGYLENLHLTWSDTERGRGPTGMAIRTREPCVARHIASDPDYEPWRDEALRRGYQSSVALPLLVNGEAFGALNLYAAEPDAFDTEEIDLLQILANDLSYGIASLRASKAHEEATREVQRLEHFNEEILQNLVAGIIVQDANLNIEYANPAAARMLGYRPEELVGRHWTSILPEDQHRIVQEADERRKRGARDQYVLELLHKDGSRIPVLVSGSPWIIDGRFCGTFAVFTDITDLMQAEKALKESEERFRIVTEGSLAGVYIVQDGILQYVNPAFCETYGYKPEEIIGKMNVTAMVHPEDLPLVAENLRKRLDGEVDLLQYQVRALRKDGSVIHCEILGRRAEYQGRPAIIGTVIDITDRVRYEHQIERQLSQLEALRKIDLAITASLDPRVTFDVLLSQVTEQLGIDAADILVFDQNTQTLNFAAGRGFRTEALRHTHLRIGEGNAGKAALDRQIVIVPNLQEVENSFSRAPLLKEEDFTAYYAVPLVAKGTVQGVMEIFHREPIAPNPEWLGFLEALASQAAIAIDNAMLFDELSRSNTDLLQAYDSTIEGWARALEIRDMETEGHSQRVTEMTLRLARRFGIDGPELMHVRRGALLHDIGKMGIPDAILNKPGALSDEEWEIMRKHPVYAYEMLSPIQYLRPALEIPYCHHEKWDGSGYPQGLKGEDIPLPARIFAVVDVWDALRSDRPYRAAWPDEKALAYIQEQSGKHFDPRVVELFFDSVISRTPPA